MQRVAAEVEEVVGRTDQVDADQLLPAGGQPTFRVTARHDVQVAFYSVLAGIGRLSARSLGLPVEYYDEEKYYKDVGSRWIGDWGADSGSKK